MAHGRPDYNITNAPTTTFQVDDLGEAIARLGFINTWDRRGDLVWQDDFETTVLKWNVTTNGAGGSVALSNAEARNGNGSLLITAPNVAGTFEATTKYIPYQRPGKQGFEISFLQDTLAPNLQYIVFYMSIYTPTHRIEPRIRYTVANGRWEYASPGIANWNLFTTKQVYWSYHIFNTVKLVVDSTTLNYERFIINDEEFDLSAYAAPWTAAAAVAVIYYGVVVYSGGANELVYLDDAIMTQNEP